MKISTSARHVFPFIATTALFGWLFVMPLSVRGQTTPTTIPAADAGPVYPTNPVTIKTAHAGILNLCAEDIPRYTQTGPLPPGAPRRHGVLAPLPHDPSLPTIWTIGDSTVRTGVNGVGEDQVGQWGWGAPLVGYFDPKKVNVVNRAVGGTTSGSFYMTLWKPLLKLIKPGDVVIMQFGTNSGGVELRGIGDETRAVPVRAFPTTRRGGAAVAGGGSGAATQPAGLASGGTGLPSGRVAPGGGGAGGAGAGATQMAHTYGWFIRQIIEETRAKGATPVVCSLIPRNSRDKNGKINRSASTQAGWARDTAAAEHAGFIDLNELVARKYDAMDKATVDSLFSGSPHTSWTGAVINAETVISGLKALKVDPVAAYYVPQVGEIAAADVASLETATQPSAR